MTIADRFTRQRLPRIAGRLRTDRLAAWTLPFTLGIGVLAAVRPHWLLLLVALALGLWAMTRPFGRLLVVIGGALISLQSSTGVNNLKYVFLGVLLTASAISAARMGTMLRDQRLKSFRAIPIITLTMCAFLLATLPIALSHGQAVPDWSRDVIAYLVIAVAPMIGLDAATGISREGMVRFLVALGAVGTVAFTITWLARRGYPLLGLERAALASLPLVVIPLAYALTRAALGPRRLAWMAYGLVLLSLLLTTGTRTVGVLAVGVLGLVGAQGKARAGIARVLTAALLSGVILALSLPALVSAITSDPTFLSRRLSSLAQAANGNDASLIQRSRAYRFVISAWRDHPLLGTGPGHYYPGVASGDAPALQLDSPFTTLAKFGIVGTAVILAFLVITAVAVARTRRAAGFSPELTSLRVALLMLIGLLPFAALLDDKGLGLTIMVAVCLAAVQTRATAAGQADPSPWNRDSGAVVDRPTSADS